MLEPANIRRVTALSLDEMRALKERALGGPEAAAAWNKALTALHDYAALSGAPLGIPVADWHYSRGEAYQDALGRAIGAAMDRRDRPVSLVRP